jgi:type II secretory pathway pseudopilin PulG
MKNQQGFTLIELVLFIIVTGLLANTILLSIVTAGQKTPVAQQNNSAAQTARRCMEWFIGQRRLLGYSIFSCPSTSVPAFCAAPTGYTVAVNITCAPTINSDSNYKTIAITVSGNGNATLTAIVADYS